MKKFLALLVILAFTLSSIIVPAVSAQDSPSSSSSIELTGTVEAVGTGTLTLNGLTIDTTRLDASLVTEVVVGTRIRVVGTPENGVIIASVLEIIDDTQPAVDLIDLEAYISIDGGATWQDADAAPGPQVEQGAQVSFRFSVNNTGTTELTNLVLINSAYDTATCAIPETLTPGAALDCVMGPFAAVAGQQTHTTTVLADAPEEQTGDTDAVYYFSGDRPSADIETYVSDDGASWNDADSAPGLKVEIGSNVFFRIVITNNGNVELTRVTLTGSVFGINTCSVPETLAIGASFECVTGPTEANASWHNDSATVTATHLTASVSDTDAVIYYGGELEDDDPVIVIIEGPVQVINVNVITIFDIDIVLDPDDPILLTLNLGDIIHIEGEMDNDDDGNIVIIVINITIVNVIIIDAPGVPSNCWVHKHGKIKCNNGRGHGSKKSS